MIATLAVAGRVTTPADRAVGVVPHTRQQDFAGDQTRSWSAASCTREEALPPEVASRGLELVRIGRGVVRPVCAVRQPFRRPPGRAAAVRVYPSFSLLSYRSTVHVEG